MLKEETASDGHTAGNNNWSPAANSHERVWVCEACENAPATFLCKADAASLCAACDAAIHTANPLARRHQRVPILPISDGRIIEDLFGEEEIEDETDSWLLVSDPKKDNHNKGNQNQNQSCNGNGLLFGGEVGEYLDLEEYNSNQFIDDNRNYEFMNHGGESVVPVDCEEEGGKDHQYNDFQLGFDFECSKSGFNFNVSSNHGVRVSSEVPNSYNGRAAKGTIDLFTSTSTGEEMRDREARVMRYREKKKNRKFEKTIRYASRKAYAETRPRIKGRFAKRTTQHMFVQPAPYGVVPSAF